MGIKAGLCLVLLIICSKNWTYSSGITSLFQQTLPTNLADFTIAASYQPSFILVYGGTLSNSTSDRTFLLNLTSSSSR